jgi:hypothetical protein
MARGDQIYVMREFMNLPGVYEHHGIDCGDGTVIHYRKTDIAQISRTSMEQFAKGQPVFTKSYTVCYIPDVVLQRAESRLGETAYNLTTNNCEHFATWCKIGVNESAQLRNFGFDLNRLSLPGSDQLIQEAIANSAPTRSLDLLQQALNNIATAENALQPQYQQAQKEMKTWGRVAELALKQGKEPVARAALERKVQWKKTVADCEAQLHHLAALKAQLQQNSRPLAGVVEVKNLW